MKHEIHNLNLPKDSRNQQLESISKDHFRPLFDADRFVLKEEFIDNGVDFRIELKLNGSVTGFGFNFQLKSTESIKPNSDGSYSKNLETSNIEYLLNNGQPAFYGFYIDQEKTIYYIDLKKIVSDLTEKNPDWQDQPNHTIRFAEKLDSNSVSTIYNIALTAGLMLRKVQSVLAESFGQIEKKDKIIIDLESNVVTDSEIVNKIEQYGLLLIDRCRWTDVIYLHKQATNTHNRSAKYNLIVGVSYYYSGEYFRSMDFLKDSYKNINVLEPYLKDYMLFFFYGLQRIMGFISEEEYEKITHSFEERGGISLHRKLEEATLLKITMGDSKDYSCPQFEAKIAEIITSPEATDYIKLLAKIEFTFYNSEKLVSQLIMMLEFGELAKAHQEFKLIHNEFHELMLESEKINSTFASHIAGLKHAIFVIHFDCILRRMEKSYSLDQLLSIIIKNLELTYDYFKVIHHVENEIYCLSVILEYYQNLENTEKIAYINDLFERYKIEYGNYDFNKKIDFTLNGGTFVTIIKDIEKKVEENHQLSERLRTEMIEMDQAEQAAGHSIEGNKHIITIMPLGNFQFPKDKIEIFFHILRITDDKLKNQLKNMFKFVIPIINCLPEKIEKEGPLRGMGEHRGMESIKAMHRIRKEMYEHKFPHIDLKFGNQL